MTEISKCQLKYRNVEWIWGIRQVGMKKKNRKRINRFKYYLSMFLFLDTNGFDLFGGSMNQEVFEYCWRSD